MKRAKVIIYVLLCLCANITIVPAQNNYLFKQDFSDNSLVPETEGRGENTIRNGVLLSKDAYAVFGEDNWTDYAIEFKARVPKGEEQVQIWAGFRAFNRFDRYVVGMKGGLSDELYLSRMGYMGTDEFLALRPLEFHPETGVWYDSRIEVCGNRIRVFINKEPLPRIDIIDENAHLAPRGPVTLGGSWIPAEFDDLTVTLLADDYLSNIPVQEYIRALSAQEKESNRERERASYNPIYAEIPQGRVRTDISLDGNWLFMPTYQMDDTDMAISPDAGDQDWHVMNVPDFWNPIRIWLHGETFNGHRKGVSDRYYQMETDRCANYSFDYKKTHAAWYRQWVHLPGNVSGKHIELTFDAVSKVAEVYINGLPAGSHIGMFGEFKADGSQLLRPGMNLIAVKVTKTLDANASGEELNTAIDFYYSSVRRDDKIHKTEDSLAGNILKDLAHGFYQENPAGIWQPVTLTITEPVRIEDVYFKPSLAGGEFEVTVKNHTSKKTKFNLTTDIIDEATLGDFHSETSLKNLELQPNEERVFTYSIGNLKPRLWTPNHPHLYEFVFTLKDDKQKHIDRYSLLSGFRTFEVVDGLFHLNGVPYWLRGGNHTPFALAPNDLTLANTFYQLMKRANVDITRTHTTPYNKLWVEAADRNGIGISHEGTWPWLMIHDSMPAEELIELWADEYIALLKKYRNHPSILFWTVNNEMKFYDLEPDFEKAKLKMRIISDVVKRMREADPTRPICFDSNYRRNVGKFGEEFLNTIDDGDIDDVHAYINWYDYTLFKFFKGEFGKHKNPGRPLISQEMSTGYPNNETGHPTRFYTIMHQNPQTLVGYQAYEYADPAAFLKVQSFITGELAEALRRSNPQASGILHFALLTWFRNVYDTQSIDPYPTYYALGRALQPVLVSAELWGRNFYAGETLPMQIYIVNDREDGSMLQPTVLHWEIQSETGQALKKGTTEAPAVAHYGREVIVPEIVLPERLPQEKARAKLLLRLMENGIEVSANEYELLIAGKSWASAAVSKKIALVDYDNTASVLDFLGVDYTIYDNIIQAIRAKADLVILVNGDWLNSNEITELKNYITKGGKALLLNSKDLPLSLYPEYIRNYILPTEGDIVNMEIPESPVFDGIGLLDLRYFNNNKREVPVVCHAAYRVNRHDNVICLANQTKIHAYIEGGIEERTAYMENIKGFPLIEVKDGGSLLISTMATEKATTDPVAGRLLYNLINYR